MRAHLWLPLILVLTLLASMGGASTPVSAAAAAPGGVLAWGDNGGGQLGDGTTGGTRHSPVPVCLVYDSTAATCTTPFTDVTALAAGAAHNLALTRSGAVYAWGNSSNGQLGTGKYSASNTPVAVCLVYDSTSGTCTTPLTGITDIAASETHSLARTSSGGVYSWGYNGNLQLGNGTPRSGSSLTPKPVCLDYNSTTNACPTPLAGVTAIAAGSFYSLALKDDTTVLAWGFNGNGELGNGTRTESPNPVAVCQVYSTTSGTCTTVFTGVTALAAGSNHSLALTSGGAVYAWGGNAVGQLGTGTTATSLTPVATCLVYNSSASTCATPFTGVSAIAAGTYGHSLAFTSVGAAYAWGNNYDGQLGNGAGAPGAKSTTPVPVCLVYDSTTATCTTPLTGVSALAAGQQHSLALTSSGGAYAWGANNSGQLGDNSTAPRPTPVQVKGPGGASTLGGIRAIAAAGFHSMAIVPPTPSVTNINPNSGPTAGGQPVTITGTGFEPSATAKLGAVNCAVTGTTTTTTLTCTTGASGPGAVDVVVTNPDGQSGTLTSGYTYVAPAAAPPPPPPPPAPVAPPNPDLPPAPGDNYTSWRSLDGVLIGIAPSTVSFNGQLYVIAVGVDNQLYERHSSDGVTFTEWRPLGGFATSAVAATVYNGELYLFVRGKEGQLYMMRSADGASFTAWRPLGGLLGGAPSAASFNGKLLVYATGVDYTLYMTSSVDGSSFSKWSSLGGVLSHQAPDATALTVSQGTLYLYARGADDRLYASSSTDGATYADWRDLGGVLTSGPAAASVGNTQVIFVRGADNRIYETRSVDGGATYSDWRELGGVLVTAPGATSFLGQVYVVTQGVDAAVYLQNSRP